MTLGWSMAVLRFGFWRGLGLMDQLLFGLMPVRRASARCAVIGDVNVKGTSRDLLMRGRSRPLGAARDGKLQLPVGELLGDSRFGDGSGHHKFLSGKMRIDAGND